MADQIQLEVITPERRALAETVESVTVPGLAGEIGILPGHTPLISQLQTGVLSFVAGGAAQRLHVSGGFVEVSADRVTVLAERAERPDEIDPSRARQAREQAERVLSAANSSDEEMEEARLQLERATIRLQLAAESGSAIAR
ncbi:MAG: F0F1 ATP synthase subunit epsilon [Pyrinomonadaceae bacterium]|jgi:F-type H+-transporting ATPase subunit epsilon|nr:F0F1 ATP synthase subunit epsilon [Pyrinomonadaceae bacterium]